MDFKSMKIEDIMDWCVTNNQVAWLKAEASRKVECKVYPKGSDGKADKTQPAKTVLRPITFIQIKTDFVNKFMPEIAPKGKPKGATMYDKIAAL